MWKRQDKISRLSDSLVLVHFMRWHCYGYRQIPSACVKTNICSVGESCCLSPKDFTWDKFQLGILLIQTGRFNSKDYLVTVGAGGMTLFRLPCYHSNRGRGYVG